MRFVWVSGRVPRGLSRFCAYCLTKIGDTGYVREMSTRILYCDHLCMGSHTALAIGYIEAQKTHAGLTIEDAFRFKEGQ